MSPVNPLTGFAFVVAACLLVHVGLRREKSALHWHLLAVLTSLLLWTAGSLMRYANTTREGLVDAQRVLFLGYCFAPALWFLLAARYRQLATLEERPALMLVPLLPSVAAYALFLTNAEHHLFFARDQPILSSGGGPLEWAGPAYWAHALASYLCAGGAVALYLRGAWQAASRAEARRAALLAAVALFPIVAGTLYLFHLLPFRWDPTASALAVSLLFLTTTVVRYNLLELLPLARRDVLEHLHDGVLIASPSGLVLDANPAAETLLGRAGATLRGRSLEDALLGVDWESDAGEAVRALTAPSTEPAPLVAELRTRGGRTLELASASVIAADGSCAGSYVVLRDRTSERRQARFASQIQKLETVGVLAAGLAHEVNNPLAFVRANLAHLRRAADALRALSRSLAEKEAQEIEDLGDVVDETLDGVDRIARIVDALRLFSRLPTEERGPVDLNEVTQTAIRLATFHENRGVEIETRLAPALPPVTGSSERLGQVVLNLLVNAKQALARAASGRIQVETRVAGEEVCVIVHDDGPGIPIEIQDRVFDPFFTTKGPDEGTGLGLSIAFDIVHDHGGVLEVESRPGEGARFSVRLPVARS